MRKRERIELIKTIITNHKITTQNDLLAKLEEASGMVMTQATISRDMNEMGIVKVPVSDGSSVYALPSIPKQPMPSSPITLTEVIRSVSEEVDESNILLLTVFPGNGYFVKRLLLEHYGDQVNGLLADDDTIVIFAKTKVFADEIRQHIQSWLQ